jgi:hypothetical protein
LPWKMNALQIFGHALQSPFIYAFPVRYLSQYYNQAKIFPFFPNLRNFVLLTRDSIFY